ncbi:MAG: hypothetical protein F2552_03255 [Actinobacteria bacterium]|nr:hypothetical protein [Actinomycetota bacterium]MTA83895.1 hypothetical protein [Actinomycetota bacterium]
MLHETNRSLPIRLVTLLAGLFVYGLGVALTVHAGIGIAPWDVLAQGISIQTGLSFGVATVAVSILVLICWIPLKVKPGFATVANALLVGLFADFWLMILPDLTAYWQQLAVFMLGVVVVAIATGLYISSRLGSGPRDGLMQGTANTLDKPFWIVRTAFEGSVLTIGWLMGGQVREGTLIFAVTIGYLVQISLKAFKIPKG